LANESWLAVDKPARNPVSKTLRALNWLVESSPPQVGVRQIAAAMNIALSSAHRILLALSEAGYVRQDRKTQRYTLGNEFFRFRKLRLKKRRCAKRRSRRCSVWSIPSRNPRCFASMTSGVRK
jgi:hypothetical protein